MLPSTWFRSTEIFSEYSNLNDSINCLPVCFAKVSYCCSSCCFVQDGIIVVVLKNYKPEFSQILANLFNIYYIYMQSWKVCPPGYHHNGFCGNSCTWAHELYIMPLLTTSEENAKNNGRHKGSSWTLIILSSKVINLEHFTQTRTITKLLIKVQILLVQSLGFKVQNLPLSTTNSNPTFAYVIHQFDILISHFEFTHLP